MNLWAYSSSENQYKYIIFKLHTCDLIYGFIKGIYILKIKKSLSLWFHCKAAAKWWILESRPKNKMGYMYLINIFLSFVEIYN